MILKVCVGSSCHLKGSYDVIEALKDIIRKCGVEAVVDLRASFCPGFCAQGVTVKAEGLEKPSIETLGKGELLLHNVNCENIEDLFLKEIYPFIKK